jgi:hypothetical protein
VRCGTADVNLKLIGRRGLIGVKSSFGQVAEWLKAAARKGCYATQVVSEVRILPLSAKSLGKGDQVGIADYWQEYGN